MKPSVSEHCGADRNSKRKHGGRGRQEILRNILSLYFLDGFPEHNSYGFPENKNYVIVDLLYYNSPGDFNQITMFLVI